MAPWSFQRKTALSVHAEHSQRPSRLAPVSYAACRMRVVVIILDHFHVRGQARHTRFAGKPPTPCLGCLSGTTVAALIRCQTRSLYFSRPGECSVRCMSHGLRESLCCSHAYACHYPCKTCKDHPLPHDRSLLMTSILIDEACVAMHTLHMLHGRKRPSRGLKKKMILRQDRACFEMAGNERVIVMRLSSPNVE